MTHDAIVVGGGFAGVTAAREVALRGRSVLLLEARDRLGGRTWSADWNGIPIEYGGGWVHWHQPHTWSEITRAGLNVALSEDAQRAHWWVGDERREGTIAERDAIAERGWNRFVEGVHEALPNPYDPLFALDELARFDRLTIAERLAELELGDEERAVLEAELESLASAPLEDAGSVSVLRWHALSGYSLALTQYTGGRVTLAAGTGALLQAIASAAPVETRLETPVAAVRVRGDRVEVETRAGELHDAAVAIVAVPLNVLGTIEFEPALSEGKQEAIAAGQTSRGLKIFLRTRGDDVLDNAIRPRHPFGYLDTEVLLGHGEQVQIGFGIDAERCDPDRLQHDLDDILPGYELIDATWHDWLADEYARGTWAIHPPGWYTRHHAEMRRPEGRVLLAGSDIANGWSGFIDGAIESGLEAGARAVRRA
ncbi:MAG TPA: NAD(P)/FAD-dependent oxidoreductase [Gaiellaceae bacterium]|jgi:monoamine oxidase|nr:NAD(P)/FAD-dependent oxidoreductase [Gaiellaceae bacterium]